MKKRTASSKRSRARNKSHLIYALLALVLGLSCHSCTNISAGRELAAAGNGLEEFVKELSTAVREHAGTPDVAPKAAYTYQHSRERTQALGSWIHHYNWHRPHQGIGGATPISRLTSSGNNVLTVHT
jgi:transposase InsO family protein